MISMIRLLVILMSRACAGTLEVNVTRSSYQATENENITLEWTFTTKHDVCMDSLGVLCNLSTGDGVSVLYHVHNGVEISESQDQRFFGRVRGATESEGRIRLNVSNLRTEDSGSYVCEVKTDSGRGSNRCHLKVFETFNVTSTQSSYQAVENDSVTLEWTFTTKLGSSSDSLFVFCEVFTDSDVFVLYHVYEGAELVEAMEDKYVGRLRKDGDALAQGRIRLQLSGLRTDDSGLYKCSVHTGYGRSSGRCRLNVTAADQPPTLRPTERPQPEKTGLHIGLGAVVVAVVIAAVVLVFVAKKKNTQQNLSWSFSEDQPIVRSRLPSVRPRFYQQEQLELRT